MTGRGQILQILRARRHTAHQQLIPRSFRRVNCAHPTHFSRVLETAGDWRGRIRGLRADASCRSHAELDESTDLDDGNPVQLGVEYRRLQSLLPKLTVFGGCCGTDHRHVQAMVTACA